MSAYTTINVTKSTAKEILITRILGPIKPKVLEKFIDNILEPHLYNCSIVPDDFVDDDDDIILNILNK